MALGDHVTTFQVKNFKGFDDLEVKNLGWVNLIVGDNNVGKTSLLEALHFDYSDAFRGVQSFGGRMFTILTKFRGFEGFSDSFLKFILNRNHKTFDSKIELSFRLVPRDGSTIEFFLLYEDNQITRQGLIVGGSVMIDMNLPESKSSVLGIDGRNNSFLDLPYIPVNLGYESDLVHYYSKAIQQNSSLKRYLLDDLKVLVPNLEHLEPAQLTPLGTIILFLKDTESSIPLPLMGEGAIKLFRILSEILVWKGQRLMIDEIDTGFHHSRMRPFWKTILTAARRHETQLFVTTHNLECIQHLKNALQEDMPDFQDEVRVVRLARVKSGVKAYTYTYPEFESAIDNENELR